MTNSAASSIPDVIRDVEELEDLLSRPGPAAIRAWDRSTGIFSSWGQRARWVPRWPAWHDGPVTWPACDAGYGASAVSPAAEARQRA